MTGYSTYFTAVTASSGGGGGGGATQQFGFTNANAYIVPGPDGAFTSVSGSYALAAASVLVGSVSVNFTGPGLINVTSALIDGLPITTAIYPAGPHTISVDTVNADKKFGLPQPVAVGDVHVDFSFTPATFAAGLLT